MKNIQKKYSNSMFLMPLVLSIITCNLQGSGIAQTGNGLKSWYDSQSQSTKTVTGAIGLAGVTVGAAYLAKKLYENYAGRKYSQQQSSSSKSNKDASMQDRDGAQIMQAVPERTKLSNKEYVNMQDHMQDIEVNMSALSVPNEMIGREGVESFTSCPFKELIQEKFNKDVPYIIVRVETHGAQDNSRSNSSSSSAASSSAAAQVTKYIHYFDAHAFNNYIFKQYPIQYRPQYLGQDVMDHPRERAIQDKYIYDPFSKQTKREDMIIKNSFNNMKLEHAHIHYFIFDPRNSRRFEYLVSFQDLLRGPQAENSQRLFLENSDYSIKDPVVLRHDNSVIDAIFKKDGHVFTIAENEKKLTQWNIDGKKCDCFPFLNLRPPFSDIVSRITMSPDEKYLAICTGNFVRVMRFDAIKQNENNAIGWPSISLNHDDVIYDVKINDMYVVTASRDKSINIMKLESNVASSSSSASSSHSCRRIHISSSAYSAAISGDMMAIGLDQGVLLHFFESNENLVHKTTDKVYNIAASHNGEYIAFTSGTNLSILYKDKPLRSISHIKPVNAFDISADDRYIITASGNKLLKFDINDFEQAILQAMQQGSQAIRQAEQRRQENIERLIPEIEQLSSQVLQGQSIDQGIEQASYNRVQQANEQEQQAVQEAVQQHQWAIQQAQADAVKKEMEHVDVINAVKISPDQKYIATASRDKSARIWDFGTGELKYVLNHDGEVRNISWSSDSKRIVTSSSDKTAKIWTLNV